MEYEVEMSRRKVKITVKEYQHILECKKADCFYCNNNRRLLHEEKIRILNLCNPNNQEHQAPAGVNDP